MIVSAVKNAIPQSLIRRRLPSTAGASVLLTFDDGPTRGVTEGVLDRLDAVGARAIFFLVGRKIADAPELAGEIHRRGHLLGNHSHDHDARRWPSPFAWRADLERCQKLIVDQSGAPCSLYRPPEGKITPMTLFGPRLAGLHHIQWSLDSGDWSCREADQARACGRAAAERAADGDIILCHDFHITIHDLLDEVVPRLIDKGFDLGRGCSTLPGGLPG